MTRKLKDDSPLERFDTQAVVGSADEAVDLNQQEWDSVQQLAGDLSDASRGLARRLVREVRPPQRGLLMLYLVKDDRADSREMFIPVLALSFPTSDKATAVSYTVSEVWRRQYGFVYDEDDQDDADDTQ